ncbi:MAG: hypothetical protein ACLQHF_04015 [Terracidiphilus sp.]
MKRILAAVFLFALALSLHAQAIDATVCDILKDPQGFNGKIVKIKGTVKAGLDEFVVVDANCGLPVNAIWLSYPEGANAKSGPLAMVDLEPASNFAGTVEEVQRTQVKLEWNKDFKQFDQLLATPVKSANMCLGCMRYEVTATLTGRVDGTRAEIKRDASGKIVGISGFGNMNAYSARLVLGSVSDIVPHEIDYSKAPANSGTPVQVPEEFTGLPPKDQLQRAHDAYGNQGDNNGLVVGGIKNEASRKSGEKSDDKSPDGVIYNAEFNQERLKGDDLSRAMAHLGEHIADLRNPEAGMAQMSVYQLEYRAWVTTAVIAIGKGQKSLTIPGGYMIWNSSWPQDDGVTNLENAVSSYLQFEAGLTK